MKIPKPGRPPVRAGIHRDVGGGGELQKRDPIPEVDGLDPPEDVGEEGGVENDESAEGGSAALRSENPVEEKPAGGDDRSGVDKTSGE